MARTPCNSGTVKAYNMTENKPEETYYYDPTTGERMTATYLVTLVVPTNYVGQIEIDAESEEQAARTALEKAYEIDWECPRLMLHRSQKWFGLPSCNRGRLTNRQKLT
jgi:hypothetical protein